jgi:hypothetical protein
MAIRVVSEETVEGVVITTRHNDKRGTTFKTYKFGVVRFVRGDDVPRVDRVTGQYLRDENGNVVYGVHRQVSSTTAQGGTLQHAVANLKAGGFSRAASFVRSALLPARGKSMVEMTYESDDDTHTVKMSCKTMMSIQESAPAYVTFTSEISAPTLPRARNLAADEIANQIVAYVASGLNITEADDEEEENVEAALDGLGF